MSSQVGLNGSAEFQLMLATLRVDSARELAMRSALQQSLEWQRLQQLASYHGVLPLVYARLKEVAPEMVPPAAMHTMAAFRKANELRVALMSRDLTNVVRALEAEAIPVLCIKGPTLATRLHGDPALRCFGDLDILVAQGDYARAEAVLHKLGVQPVANDSFSAQETTVREFTPEREREFIFAHHQYIIELHWRLATREFPRALETTGLFARSQQVLLHGQPLSTLSDLDIAVHLCLHGTQHCWGKLNHLVDFASALCLLNATGWEEFLEATHRQGLFRSLSVAAPLCHELLGVDLPEKALERGSRHPLTRWVVKLTRANILASTAGFEPVNEYVFKFATVEKARYQGLVNLLRNTFSPTTNDYQWLKLPGCLRWLYPVLRPFRRLGKGVAIICGWRKSS